MLSPSTPSRSASRTASTTTRCLLSPTSDATWRCSLAATGLLVLSTDLTSVQCTRHSTPYAYTVRVQCTSQRKSQLGRPDRRERLNPCVGTPRPAATPADGPLLLKEEPMTNRTKT